MGLLVFEVEQGFEAKVAAFLEGHGYEFVPKTRRVHPDGAHPGIEQSWSINGVGKVVATLTIMDTNKGRKLLVWGRLRDQDHKEIYRLLKDESIKLGTKPLDDFNGAFEPVEKAKN